MPQGLGVRVPSSALIMKSTIEKREDGTIELKLTIPSTIVKKETEIVIEEYAKSATLPGFRKGKAPKKLLEEKIDKAKIKDEVIRRLLPQAYVEAVKEHNLKPIMDPQIHIEGELSDGKDWQFHALTAEAPVVNLNGYKEAVKKVTAKGKIIVPGGEKEEPKLDEIIKALMGATTIKVPQVLVQKEADRSLSQTLDEIKRLGMTLDQYLTSVGKTAEVLRAEYMTQAEADLKLEFVLHKIAESEKITVTDADIQKTIDNAKSPSEKESLSQNRYLLASILRQQKTLDFLKTL